MLAVGRRDARYLSSARFAAAGAPAAPDLLAVGAVFAVVGTTCTMKIARTRLWAPAVWPAAARGVGAVWAGSMASAGSAGRPSGRFWTAQSVGAASAGP